MSFGFGLGFPRNLPFAGGPSLNFQFAGSTTLDPQITFTRASSATYFDSTGTLTTAANNVPRLDYDPATLAARGLLIEEQRVNSIRNNTMQGAVAGTPGTLPTNWSIGGAGTLTQTVVGTGTENGVTYIDIRINGTTSTTQFQLRFEPSTQIAAANGQSWTISNFIRVAGGSQSNITGIGLTMSVFDNVGTYLNDIGSGNVTVTSTLTRVSRTGTIASASAAFIRPITYISFNSGVAIDITLRIGLPQLEQGAFATSVIPTTGAAATRSQDRAVVSTLSPWFNATTGTIYAEFSVAQPVSGANQFVARFSDNSYNNQMGDFVSTTGFVALATASGGVFDGLASTAVAVIANTNAKFAGAYAVNDLAACKDGGAVATDNTATIPSGMTRFDLGSDHAGLNNIKAGYLRRITYYPRRLSNAELVSITS